MGTARRFALVGALALVACGKRTDDGRGPADPAPGAPAGDRASATATVDDASAASPAGEARSIFATRCAGCHGQSGKGDGPTAASLNPAPRDYTDKAWQASVTDADLARVIVEGGGALGRSQMMPPAPDLREKPAVVAELVKLIRSFGG